VVVVLVVVVLVEVVVVVVVEEVESVPSTVACLVFRSYWSRSTPAARPASGDRGRRRLGAAAAGVRARAPASCAAVGARVGHVRTPPEYRPRRRKKAARVHRRRLVPAAVDVVVPSETADAVAGFLCRRPAQDTDGRDCDDDDDDGGYSNVDRL